MNAQSVMSVLNRSALHSQEGGKDVYIEDVRDPDGRWYRLEYRCAADGSNATAWCINNPWGTNTFSYVESHLSHDGFVCVGEDSNRERSPYKLDFVVKRARPWCTGYSFLREHGYKATCAAMPEWGRP